MLLHRPEAQPRSSCKANCGLPQAYCPPRHYNDPNTSKGFECYADANFAGTFNKLNTSDPMSCLSWTGYVISYANCPILWSSKMQSIITLSYDLKLNTLLCLLPCGMLFTFCNSVTELQENVFQVPTQGPPKVSCRVFEDNAGALELANNPNLHP